MVTGRPTPLLIDWLSAQALLEVEPEAGREGGVWYLGSRYGNLLALESGGKIETCGARLNRIFDDLKDDFVNLDQHLVSGRLSHLWDGSDLAERSPFTSDFIITCCRALAMLEILTERPGAMVVLDDGDMVQVMVEVAARAGIVVRSQGRRSGKWKRWVRFLLDLGLQRAAQGWRWLRAAHQLQKIRRSKPLRWEALRAADSLIVTWNLGKSFGGPSGANPDAYHGRLPVLLKGQGQSIAWLGNSTDWMRSLEDMAETAISAADPVILFQDLWTAGDIIGALLESLAFPLAVRRRLTLGGAELTPLLRRAVRQEVRSARLSFALLYGKTVKRLAAKGLTPKTILYPYERQPWELALLASARRWLPQTQMIGHMHAPLASRYLSFLPSRREVGRGLKPGCMLVIGDHYRRCLVEAGFPEKNILTIGAFRFEGAFAVSAVGERTQSRTVLCPCPINFGEALELVRKTAQAVRDLPGVGLLVNFHPAADRSFRGGMERQLEPLLPKERVEFSGEPAASLLSRVACVVYNASGVVFEAARMGVPAVFIGSDVGLDLDKLPGGGQPPRSVDELRAVLAHCLDNPEKAEAIVTENSQRAAEAFTPPVTELP